MGCCIFGIILLACLYRIRKRLANVMGIDLKEVNPALWSLHTPEASDVETQSVEGSPSPKLPWITPKFAVTLSMASVFAVITPIYIAQHYDHIKTDLACLSLKLQIPLESAWENCHGDGMCHTSDTVTYVPGMDLRYTVGQVVR